MQKLFFYLLIISTLLISISPCYARKKCFLFVAKNEKEVSRDIIHTSSKGKPFDALYLLDSVEYRLLDGKVETYNVVKSKAPLFKPKFQSKHNFTIKNENFIKIKILNNPDLEVPYNGLKLFWGSIENSTSLKNKVGYITEDCVSDWGLLKIADIYRSSNYSENYFSKMVDVEQKKYEVIVNSKNINDLGEFIKNLKATDFYKSYQSRYAYRKMLELITMAESTNEKMIMMKEYQETISSNNYDQSLGFYNSWESKFPTQSNKVYNLAYQIVHKENTIDKYRKLTYDFNLGGAKYDEYQKVLSNIYDVVKSQNKVLRFKWFMDKYDSDFGKDALLSLYELIKSKNNISGYKWFIDNYKDSKESKDALLSIYRLAFEEAEDIDTIEAYNDFIIAYPYAKEVKQATKLAYDLELAEYTGWFSSDEDNSRALLIKSKRLARKMKKQDYKAGYMLVINRMNELLQDAFPSEEATLRHLESEEFMDFVDKFDNAMDRINRNLRVISDNTENLSSILRDQSNMMDSYFRESAQEQEMANFHTKQHQFWQRYLKDDK